MDEPMFRCEGCGGAIARHDDGWHHIKPPESYHIPSPEVTIVNLSEYLRLHTPADQVIAGSLDNKPLSIVYQAVRRTMEQVYGKEFWTTPRTERRFKFGPPAPPV